MGLLVALIPGVIGENSGDNIVWGASVLKGGIF